MSLPDRLYHGTSIRHLDSILNNGILPRGTRRPNSDTFKSAPNRVYLAASGHAIRFGVDALKQDDSAIVVFEINPHKLNPNKLIADEDCLLELEPIKSIPTFKRRIQRAQALAVNYPASMSLEIGGSCSYLGSISARHILRYAIVDYKAQFSFLVGCWDTSTSPLAWQLTKKRHDSRIHWLFDSVETEVPPGTPERFAMFFRAHPTGSREGIKVERFFHEKSS